MTHHQNAEKNHNVKIADRSLENVAKFKYLGTRVINQNLVHGEIKSRLNYGNISYYSVQNIQKCNFACSIVWV
jgi:hypothetical protein